MKKQKALLFWSSGKDSAMSLYREQQKDEIEIVALVTGIHEQNQQATMHQTPLSLLQVQAQECGLPLWTISVPWPCPNIVYEQRLQIIIQKAHRENITAICFGDLFLEEIRSYRENIFRDSQLQLRFPLWCSASETYQLGEEMIACGIRATFVSIGDPIFRQNWLGKEWHEWFGSSNNFEIDPCGENGEFHTFCHHAPIFRNPISFSHDRKPDPPL